ncbi:MAG: stage II sporulation protein M [Lachnospiraceae bacterium]|nr:stage II sporulation protein M [Lachnospiraceae bacterium]
MEKKILLKSIVRTLIIIQIVFIVGSLMGVVLEMIYPSEYTIQILKEEEIFQNNINILFKVNTVGIASVGIWCIFFIFMLGKTVGESVFLIYENYGWIGICKGFIPHAVLEIISCFLGAMLPLFVWQIIIRGFFRKSSVNKRYLVISSIGICVFGLVMMYILCRVAANLEFNVSEIYWKTK